jgi:hypothetical protein
VVKNKLGAEVKESAQEPENEDYISLDVCLTSNGDSTNPMLEKMKRRQEAKLHDRALDQIMAEELGPSITESGRHIEAELEKKRKKKEEKRAEKRKRRAEDDESHESSVDAMEVNTEADAIDDVDTPKIKKKKLKVEHTSDDEEAETPKEKKEKKDKKKDKKEHAAEGNGTSEPGHVDDLPKEKKDKRKKEKKVKEEEAQESVEEYVPKPTTEGGEQWNVSALDGDDKRKQKFLRLLGAKKPNGASSDGHTASTSSKADIAKIQSDLERQFDVGMKMKEAGHSRRKGLGA